MEFDHEMPLWSDFPWPRSEDELIETKAKVLKFEKPDDEDLVKGKGLEKGDLSFPCMKYASVFRQSPASIAEQLKPYVADWDFLEKVEVKGGYLNMFFNRARYLQEYMNG